MANFLFFSDLHIRKDELQECTAVLDEILQLCKTYNIDKVFDLGDTFNKINPESECLDLFSTFIEQLHRPIIILAANSHESTTPSISVINHFSILKETIEVVKEYKDDNYLYCGHFIVNESKKNYGGSVSKKNLAKYKYVILGHGHSYETIAPNVCQLGSCRYIDFAESQDKSKMIAICENYQSKNEIWTILPLQSPCPMQDVIIEKNVATAKPSVKSQEGTLVNVMNSLSPQTKIRLVWKDFESYCNNINSLEQFRHKFILFREKKDFLIQENALITAKTESVSLKESLETYLINNKINQQITDILMKELK